MKPLTRWRSTEDPRIRWRLEFKVEDLWIGAFWRFIHDANGGTAGAELWVCLLPCLPLHFEITLDADGGAA